MRRRRLLAAAAAVAAAVLLAPSGPSAGASPAPPPVAPTAPTARAWTTLTTTVATRDGRRPLLVALPASWATRHRGALVVLHGAGSSVAAMQRVSSVDAEGTRAGLAVVDLVAAGGSTTSWNAGTCCFGATARHLDDVGYVAAAVAWLRARWGLPASAVTVVGYSNGGMLGYRVVCERPGLVGRLVVVEGARLVPCPSSSRRTPVLVVHGDADRTVPLTGTRWQPWLRVALPSAATSVAPLAARDGCRGWARRVSGAVTALTGTGCAVPVRFLVVHGLTHRWSRSVPVDETALAVRFALGLEPLAAAA